MELCIFLLKEEEEKVTFYNFSSMKIFQIDAFTDHLFGGNPAAVCPLDAWLPDEIMQKIALENNLSETAFFVGANGTFEIRWFSPEMEIDLCGHATLASAHVIFNHLGYKGQKITFRYKEGLLSVVSDGALLSMDFPAIPGRQVAVTNQMVKAMKKPPIMAGMARDLLLLYEREQDVRDLAPDFVEVMQLDCLGVIATAPGEKIDFVSRFFAPRAGINEDPVTGSAHSMLIPFWAERLNKPKMEALQLSKRGGKLLCTHNDSRVIISGTAITYMIGELFV